MKEENISVFSRSVFIRAYFFEVIFMKSKKMNIRALTVTGVMGALAFALMMLEFSIPIMPAFIKLDFSELPALITGFAYGPLWGIAVCFIKNFIHVFISSTGAIGEVSNFILGAVFVGTSAIIYKNKRNKKWALISCVIASAVMSIFSVFSNYFVVYPLYVKVLGMPEAAILGMYQAILPSVDNLFEAIAIFNLPFNFVKMILVSVICFAIYKRISPIMKKQ